MKPVTAYALVYKRNKYDSLPVLSEHLPLFWLKGIADEAAETYGGRVIKVQILPITHED